MTIKTSNFLLIVLYVLSIFIQNTQAQTDVRSGSFAYPSIMQKKEYKHELSLLLAKLPEESIEEVSNWIYAPLFIYNAKYGLAKGFNLNGIITTNIITFQFRGGAQWQYELNKVSFAAGFDAAYWFGKLKHFGFNSTAKGWQNYPYLAFGIAFDKFTVTAKSEFNFMLYMKESADDIETSTDKNIFNGFLFSIMIEQPLWKDHYMSIGFNFNYTKIYWPSWAVFPSWDRYIFVPEVLIGFVL